MRFHDITFFVDRDGEGESDKISMGAKYDGSLSYPIALTVSDRQKGRVTIFIESFDQLSELKGSFDKSYAAIEAKMAEMSVAAVVNSADLSRVEDIKHIKLEGGQVS